MLYREIALKMAIRHPRVGEILSHTITEDGEMELAMEYGLFYKKPSSDIKDLFVFRSPASRTELMELYPAIEVKDLRFSVAFDIAMIVSNDKESINKLLPSGQNKGGLMLNKINFDWYDHVKIHGKSEYSLDPSRNEKNQIKKNNDILHDYIINKRWFELLDR